MSSTAEEISSPPPGEPGISTGLDVNVRLWQLASFAIAGMVAAPILIVMLSWFSPAGDIWRHLAQTVLGELLRNTVVLMIGVGFGVFVLGARLAWLIAMCEFPGRRFFEWALMLPLAMPAY